MAIPSDRDLVQLGPFPQGANNLTLENRVPRGAFRRAVNVDVTDDGRLVRRDGSEKVLDADAPHSLFGYGARGFFVEEQTLYGFEVIDGVATEPVELVTGLTPDVRLAHCMIEPDIYVSDGDRALRLTPTNEVISWTLPAAQAPALAAGAGGLDAGRYHVAAAFRSASGEEGPLGFPTTIDVVDGSSISIALPSLPSGYRYAVYMTKPNGTELLHAGNVSTGSFTVSKQRLGRPSPTEDMDPMPAGQHACLWNGRLVVGRNNEVWWSEPMMYGLTMGDYNYLVLSEAVTGVGATETSEGFFVGQGSRTYFLRGANPNDGALHEVYPAGMVAGTLTYVPGARLPLEQPPTELVPMWMATNGVFCVGLPSGSVLPLSETRYAAQVASEGAAMFDQRAGKNRYIATLKNPSENNFALSDSFTAEVIRNGN